MTLCEIRKDELFLHETVKVIELIYLHNVIALCLSSCIFYLHTVSQKPIAEQTRQKEPNVKTSRIIGRGGDLFQLFDIAYSVAELNAALFFCYQS